jgi:hypothetical protein
MTQNIYRIRSLECIPLGYTPSRTSTEPYVEPPSTVAFFLSLSHTFLESQNDKQRHPTKFINMGKEKVHISLVVIGHVDAGTFYVLLVRCNYLLGSEASNPLLS